MSAVRATPFVWLLSTRQPRGMLLVSLLPREALPCQGPEVHGAIRILGRGSSYIANRLETQPLLIMFLLPSFFGSPLPAETEQRAGPQCRKPIFMLQIRSRIFRQCKI